MICFGTFPQAPLWTVLFLIHRQTVYIYKDNSFTARESACHLLNSFEVYLYRQRRLSLKTVNTLRPRQNGRHLADDIFKCIFFIENVWIPIKNSLKFVPRGPINNIPALVQIMAWRRPGDKPLYEPMMFRLPTHICVTRPQWVNIILRRTFFDVSRFLYINSLKKTPRMSSYTVESNSVNDK